MTYQIYNENCLEGLKKIPDGSVDMILDDLPFGSTDCGFDEKLPLDEMWREFKRVTKHNAAILLFSQMPFGAELITSNPKMFRHEWIYDKTLPVGFLNAHKMPMRRHENILVFYRALPTYNPQFTYAEPYYKKAGNAASENYSKHNRGKYNSDGKRYPVDVLKFPQPYCEAGQNWHPQQKPVGLLEYLIKTYTNEGETVLDATMGSGSTGVAAVNCGRKFIGFELTERYFEIAKNRIESADARKEKLTARLSSGNFDVVYKQTAELIPYENNPRINDNAVNAIAKSISEFGFKQPIVIDSGNVIVAGHTRLKAAQKLGLKSVPCIVADDLSEEEIKAFRIADNKTGELATWIVEDLNQELAELTNFDMKDFGFSEKELKRVEIKPADFEKNFNIEPVDDKPKEFKVTFLLHKKQSALIRKAMNSVNMPDETFGNTNQTGNLLYEIVRQWTEFRSKSK